MVARCLHCQQHNRRDAQQPTPRSPLWGASLASHHSQHSYAFNQTSKQRQRSGGAPLRSSTRGALGHPYRPKEEEILPHISFFLPEIRRRLAVILAYSPPKSREMGE